MLYWENMDNRRTKGRWAQISPNREKKISNGCLIVSKEVIVVSRRQLVLSLSGIQGINLYKPFDSCDSLEGDKLYLKRCTMALMYMTLETIGCTKRLNVQRMERCQEYG